MTTTNKSAAFDIFAGLDTGGFLFRGLDKDNGATFEHQPCGAVVRFGPMVRMVQIGETIAEHNCEEYKNG